MSDQKEALAYETEEAQQDALLAIQDKPGGPSEEDLDEIERISNVEVKNAVNPADDVVEEEEEVLEEKPLEETR